MGVYSNKVKDVTKLRDGATVAVPNDTTNEARALKLLAANGVIKLKDGAGTDRHPERHHDQPEEPEVQGDGGRPVPRSLDDVDAAVINGNYAIDADLKPARTPSSWSPRRTTRTPTSSRQEGQRERPAGEEAREAPRPRPR